MEPKAPRPFSSDMDRFDRCWLLTNSASGSNTPEAVAGLLDCFAGHGIEVDRTIGFPDESLPSPTDLDGAGIGLLVIYTGDGSLNAALTELKGWGGAVLVLPGGTMNLLSKRLHGDYPVADIVALVASGGARRRRVTKISGACGDAYAGLLAGPGTHWGNVREAMRSFDIAGIASGAAEAVAKSTGDSKVHAIDPPFGAREGYPLLELTPGEHGIGIHGYYANTAGDLVAQTWALMRRSFREGPHDRLGVVDELTVGTVDGSPLELLLDGEACEAGPTARFQVAESEMDLLATHHA